MFRGPDQIASIVERFETRDVSLWHACQLRDFRSYLEVGGLPSRSLLEQGGAGFTHLQTDVSDRSKGVWDKVLVNLSDFGAAFAHGAAATEYQPWGPPATRQARLDRPTPSAPSRRYTPAHHALQGRRGRALESLVEPSDARTTTSVSVTKKTASCFHC
jgi:hypothetical protein